MNKRDHGNNHLKKECHSCLGLLKEVDKYWNTQKKKTDNEEEEGQETCRD